LVRKPEPIVWDDETAKAAAVPETAVEEDASALTAH
jgi:hypothetical protein